MAGKIRRISDPMEILLPRVRRSGTLPLVREAIETALRAGMLPSICIPRFVIKTFITRSTMPRLLGQLWPARKSIPIPVAPQVKPTC